VIAAALYGPFGVAGIVIGTVVGTVVMCVAQGLLLRGALGGVEGARTLRSAARMLPAAALLGGAAWGVWYLLDDLLGRSLAAQLAAVGAGIAIGLGVYAGAVWTLRVPEARQIRALLPGRFGGGGPG
jgi:putative peptidoglycan lipid II flippase